MEKLSCNALQDGSPTPLRMLHYLYHLTGGRIVCCIFNPEQKAPEERYATRFFMDFRNTKVQVS